MLIRWCLKGIPESTSFKEKDARSILARGMPSRWLLLNAALSMKDGINDAQASLGASALDDHVNNYWAVSHNTPYISLSTGIVVPATSGVSVIPAWRTAVDFATQGGKTSGYVFRCWTIVSPKPSASLPNISDEVRDLNVFRQFWIFHTEGEIAAKLFVPASQIEWFQKIDANLKADGDRVSNAGFVSPTSICNIIEAVT